MDGTTLTNASAVDRNSVDFYPTPPDVTKALTRYFHITGKRILEPACGNGAMARALEEEGNEVCAFDLYQQGYGEAGHDFLNRDDRSTNIAGSRVDWIITNPPFKLAAEFIERALEFKKPVAMLLKSQYWHAKGRTELFRKHPPSHVLALTWRPDFHFGAKGGSPTMECQWSVWHPYQTNVTIFDVLTK